MFRRYLMIGVAMLALTACADKNKGDVDVTMNDGIMASEQDMSGHNGAQPGTQEDLVVNVGDRVFFATDSSDLNQKSRTTLENQAAWLQQYPNVNVLVEGHADERGTREYNLALGERRANTVKNYLISLGVNPSRISTVSYGKERPAVPGSDEMAWSQNRRGVTVVQ